MSLSFPQRRSWSRLLILPGCAFKRGGGVHSQTFVTQGCHELYEHWHLRTSPLGVASAFCSFWPLPLLSHDQLAFLQEGLCDQRFNHNEKRLARVLLKLARLHEFDLTREDSDFLPASSHLDLLTQVIDCRHVA